MLRHLADMPELSENRRFLTMDGSDHLTLTSEGCFAVHLWDIGLVGGSPMRYLGSFGDDQADASSSPAPLVDGVRSTMNTIRRHGAGHRRHDNAVLQRPPSPLNWVEQTRGRRVEDVRYTGLVRQRGG